VSISTAAAARAAAAAPGLRSIARPDEGATAIVGRFHRFTERIEDGQHLVARRDMGGQPGHHPRLSRFLPREKIGADQLIFAAEGVI
jgi:hypothetical protein